MEATKEEVVLSPAVLSKRRLSGESTVERWALKRLRRKRASCDPPPAAFPFGEASRPSLSLRRCFSCSDLPSTTLLLHRSPSSDLFLCCPTFDDPPSQLFYHRRPLLFYLLSLETILLHRSPFGDLLFCCSTSGEPPPQLLYHRRPLCLHLLLPATPFAPSKEGTMDIDNSVPEMDDPPVQNNEDDEIQEEVFDEIYRKATEDRPQSLQMEQYDTSQSAAIQKVSSERNSLLEPLNQGEGPNDNQNRSEIQITDEQRARMEANRLKALERAAARSRAGQPS